MITGPHSRGTAQKESISLTDRDDAGERAAQSLAEELMAMGIECFRVQFPKGMDANEYALKVTPAAKSLGVLLHLVLDLPEVLRGFGKCGEALGYAALWGWNGAGLACRRVDWTAFSSIPSHRPSICASSSAVGAGSLGPRVGGAGGFFPSQVL